MNTTIKLTRKMPAGTFYHYLDFRELSLRYMTQTPVVKDAAPYTTVYVRDGHDNLSEFVVDETPVEILRLLGTPLPVQDDPEAQALLKAEERRCTPLTEFGFSERVLAVFEFNNFHTLADLDGLDADHLRNLNGIGKITIMKIRKVLKDYGMSLCVEENY